MEHIYQTIIPKVHTNVNELQITQWKYYNMWPFNNLFEVGEKVLKENMVDDSHEAKKKTKWTGPYTIVEFSVMGGYELKDKHGYILKTHFSQSK